MMHIDVPFISQVVVLVVFLFVVCFFCFVLFFYNF